MEGRPPHEQLRDQVWAWTQHVMTAGSTGSHESYRQFYWGFTWKHEPVVWGFMEENYLRRYRGCLRVDFDWMADRLWEIPFPGSVYMGISVELEGFGISGSLAARGRAWQASQDRLDVAEKDPDPGAIDAEGLDISKEVKLFLGNDYYVEYRPFREISIKGGEAVELEAPAFIADLAR